MEDARGGAVAAVGDPSHEAGHCRAVAPADPADVSAKAGSSGSKQDTCLGGSAVSQAETPPSAEAPSHVSWQPAGASRAVASVPQAEAARAEPSARTPAAAAVPEVAAPPPAGASTAAVAPDGSHVHQDSAALDAQLRELFGSDDEEDGGEGAGQGERQGEGEGPPAAAQHGSAGHNTSAADGAAGAGPGAASGGALSERNGTAKAGGRAHGAARRAAAQEQRGGASGARGRGLSGGTARPRGGKRPIRRSPEGGPSNHGREAALPVGGEGGTAEAGEGVAAPEAGVAAVGGAEGRGADEEARVRMRGQASRPSAPKGAAGALPVCPSVSLPTRAVPDALHTSRPAQALAFRSAMSARLSFLLHEIRAALQVLAFVRATLDPLHRAGLLGREGYKRAAAKVG